MDRSSVDALVEKLRRGASVALVVDREAVVRRPLLQSIERQLAELGRTVLWIDLEGAISGAELGGRIVEGCLPELDHDELGDLLERLPSRGRLDLEAFAELLMLPETVAVQSGRRVVTFLDGFENVERVIGMSGLGVVRDALLMREQVAYLFVGSPRLSGLFGRPQLPLYGLAEVVELGLAAAPQRRAPTTAPAVPPAEVDPLAAALLGWAEAPPKQAERTAVSDKLVIARQMPSAAEVAWERFVARERRDRRDRWEIDEAGDDEDPWSRRQRPRRRR